MLLKILTGVILDQLEGHIPWFSGTARKGKNLPVFFPVPIRSAENLKKVTLIRAAFYRYYMKTIFHCCRQALFVPPSFRGTNNTPVGRYPIPNQKSSISDFLPLSNDFLVSVCYHAHIG
jgi:hypothetical protein